MTNTFSFIEPIHETKDPIEVWHGLGPRGSELVLIRYSISLGGNSVTLFKELWPVQRETPKCYVIHWGGPAERWILKDPKGKRFAYLSDEDAMNSLRIRTRRRVQHARNALDAALRAQEFLENFK